jgi:hypothetical protein
MSITVIIPSTFVTLSPPFLYLHHHLSPFLTHRRSPDPSYLLCSVLFCLFFACIPTVLQLFLSSSKSALRFAAMRTLSEVAVRQPVRSAKLHMLRLVPLTFPSLSFVYIVSSCRLRPRSRSSYTLFISRYIYIMFYTHASSISRLPLYSISPMIFITTCLLQIVIQCV